MEDIAERYEGEIKGLKNFFKMILLPQLIAATLIIISEL